jgi:hypothetical protein
MRQASVDLPQQACAQALLPIGNRRRCLGTVPEICGVLNSSWAQTSRQI